MLAALWKRPQATYASSLELHDGTARATRETDAGLEVVDIELPAVVTTDLRLNEPRFVKLPEILKARGKPIERLTAEELGVQIVQRLEVLNVVAPPEREAGIMVDSVDALIEALQSRGAL
jgi:electron transfer flavoprotein beta subunit